MEDGDRIRLDLETRTLDLLVDDSDLERRRAAWTPPDFSNDRGYLRLYRQHVLQANDGCDFVGFEGSSAVVSDALTHL